MGDIDLNYTLYKVQDEYGFIDLNNTMLDRYDDKQVFKSIDRNIYYRVNNWIYIDYLVLYKRMIKFLTDEGYIIDQEILTHIIVSLTNIKVDEVNQEYLKYEFYKDIKIITKPMTIKMIDNYYVKNSIDISHLVELIKKQNDKNILILDKNSLKSKDFYFREIKHILSKKFKQKDFIPIEDFVQRSRMLKINNLDLCMDILNARFDFQLFKTDSFILPFNYKIIIDRLEKYTLDQIIIADIKEIKLDINEVYNFKDIDETLKIIFFEYFKYIHFSNINCYFMAKDSDITLSDKLLFIFKSNGKNLNFKEIERQYIHEFNEELNFNEFLNCINNSKVLNRIGDNLFGIKKNDKIDDTDEVIIRKGKKLDYIEDEILNYFLEKNRPIHYNEIGREVATKLDISEGTVTGRLRNMDLLNNGKGMYALSLWKPILSEEYTNKKKFIKQIKDRGYNLNNNYYIKYNITENLLRDRKVRIPSAANYKFDKFIKLVNTSNEEFIVEYKDYDRSLVNLDAVIHVNNIYLGEVIVLEIIDSSKIYIFMEEEYEKYLKGEISMITEEEDNYFTKEKNDLIDEMFSDIFLKE